MREWMRRLAPYIVFCLLLGFVAAYCCRGSRSCALAGRIIYNQVVAPSREKPQYYRELDLFCRDLPGESSPVRLTDFQHDPLLGPGASNPQWSPDGRHVLFFAESKAAPTPKNAGSVRLFPWTLDVKTKAVRSITQPTDNRWYLDAIWSRDGKSIIARVAIGASPQFYYYADLRNIFVSSGGKIVLLTIDTATRNERILDSNLGLGLLIGSTQDGVIVNYGGDQFKLINAKTGKRSYLCASNGIDAWAVSPDARELAFYSKSAVYVCNLNTRKVRLLYKGSFSGMHGASLCWSPDGKWIALRHSVTDVASVDPPVADTSSYIVAVNVSTRQARGFPNPKIDAANEAGGLRIVGWAKDSKCLILRKDSSTGDPYPRDSRTELIAYPLADGSAIPVAEIIGYLYDLAWRPE